MAITATLLASGPGWQVNDVLCDAGPAQRPYEERHENVCIAAVTEGTFQYRSAQGTALLSPGSFLLGDAGRCFACSHDHGTGDRCLAFTFTPAYFESIVAAIPGARAATFGVPRLPVLPKHLALFSALEAARDRHDAREFEELALRVAAAVTSALAGHRPPASPASARDEARITLAVRRIEAAPDGAWTLAELAAEAAMSPYHFLRTFRRIVGLTPHQWLLHTRVRRAATLLRASETPVATIAYECGFGDLSTFNRRFRGIFGATPSTFRTLRQAQEAAARRRPSTSSG